MIAHGIELQAVLIRTYEKLSCGGIFLLMAVAKSQKNTAAAEFFVSGLFMRKIAREIPSPLGRRCPLGG
jgi:hypothetical protein